MLKKIFALILPIVLTLSSIFTLNACSKKDDPNTVIVGTSAGPESQLWETVKAIALQQYGLKITIVPFTDYNTPNEALSDGSLDANAFQHIPYLDAQIKQHGYKLVPIGKTFIYPMGAYSKKIKNISELVDGAIVAIPNDPSNEARALLLLQKEKLITLKPGIDFTATPIDILNNPKKLIFKELDAAQLPRALPDVDLAAINTNYAIAAGLSPTKDSLFIEDQNSPYANIIVVRTADKDKRQLNDIVKAFQSQAVKDEAKRLFGESAVPAW